MNKEEPLERPTGKHEQTVRSVYTTLAWDQVHRVPLTELLKLAGFSRRRVGELSKARCRRAQDGIVVLDFGYELIDAIRVGSYYLIFYADGWTGEKDNEYWRTTTRSAADAAEAMWNKA